MSEPLGRLLSQRLEPEVHVYRRRHLGTGISKASPAFDWRDVAAYQADKYRADAVVVFLGANDGFPMRGSRHGKATCCGVGWVEIYSRRAEAMMNHYRRRGLAHVYWLTLPAPRDPRRQRIWRAINRAVTLAAERSPDTIHVIDTVPIVSPDFVYRPALEVSGAQTPVRNSDGMHLSRAGAAFLMRHMLRTLGRDLAFR